MLGNLHEREVSPFTTLILTLPPRLPFSLPDRYEQMFTPQLRSRYWLRRRRRRNDKSFRKWRRACDTRVERGHRHSVVAAPFSLTHSSLSRESGEVSVRGTRQKEGTSVRNLSLSQSNICAIELLRETPKIFSCFSIYPPPSRSHTPPTIWTSVSHSPQAKKNPPQNFHLFGEQLLDRRCVTPNPIDLYDSKIYRYEFCLHPLPITGIKRGFIKLDTLRGHSRRQLSTAFIPSMVTSFTSYLRLAGSKVQNRKSAVACCKRGEGRRERNDMGPWRIGRCISESEAARPTNVAAANDRRCACGAIIALTRPSS